MQKSSTYKKSRFAVKQQQYSSMVNCTIENNCTYTKPGSIIDNFVLFLFCLITNFYFGFLALAAHASYRYVRLHQYGKHTVGVVQSSKIEI
jgi:hypothetical protein